ncbi:thioredoxin-like protein [Tilletiaria anomala UBC 951]|uniref:glutathione transferase n=1 Tax=Tilletiaria anomala (strain ATCC 24038 / CBS 436.72 / UBC 951) TaxID=1037660 RepID=A0A066WIM2_TILAU|nr:thioredoxin-like protein [Tilletiaria anomala UBC 951]KDN52378.1 thioredoxin-like protein [Tilletiaria anomala UBC 951]
MSLVDSATAAPAAQEATPAAAADTADVSTAPPAAAPAEAQAASSDLLVVHHLNDSRSQRILWLLEELQIPYTIKKYQRTPLGLAPKELFAVHPLGKSPAITDNGKIVAESGVIIEYLIKKYGKGKFVPTLEDSKMQDTFWLHWAEGSAMNWLLMKLIFTIVPQKAPFIARPIVSGIFSSVCTKLVDPEVQKIGNFVSNELTKTNGGWLAGGDGDGNPTAADFQMMFVAEAMASGRLPNVPDSIKTYVQKIHERTAYKRALEKGGTYAYGKL